MKVASILNRCLLIFNSCLPKEILPSPRLKCKSKEKTAKILQSWLAKWCKWDVNSNWTDCSCQRSNKELIFIHRTVSIWKTFDPQCFRATLLIKHCITLDGYCFEDIKYAFVNDLLHWNLNIKIWRWTLKLRRKFYNRHRHFASNPYFWSDVVIGKF